MVSVRLVYIHLIQRRGDGGETEVEVYVQPENKEDSGGGDEVVVCSSVLMSWRKRRGWRKRKMFCFFAFLSLRWLS